MGRKEEKQLSHWKHMVKNWSCYIGSGSSSKSYGVGFKTTRRIWWYPHLDWKGQERLAPDAWQMAKRGVGFRRPEVIMREAYVERSCGCCWRRGSTSNCSPLGVMSAVDLSYTYFVVVKDQALSLWSGSTDSKTLDYQRTNPMGYQIVRTHTMEITGIQDPASPNHQ